MHRRLLLLALPIALVLPACTDDDSPAVGNGDATTSSQATSSTSSSTTSTTAGTGTTTTVKDEPGTPLLGPEGTSGSVRYSLDSARSNFCYRIAIEGAGTATQSHIHRLKGEPVLTLTPPGADGKVDTCVATDALLLQELEASPNRFYVDVHTPKGLLRGNLG